jgi:tetratricopeptide (TPR) repeat protein
MKLFSSSSNTSKRIAQGASSRLLLWMVVCLLGVFLIVEWSPIEETILANLIAYRVMREAATPGEARSGAADAWLDSVLDFTLRSARTARLRGYHYLYQGQAADAVESFENAGVSDRMAALWLGKAYDLQGRHSEATAAYRHAGAAVYFLKQGHPPYEMGDYETACRNYSRAVEIAPQIAVAHMYMGHCYLRRGEFLLAEASYRRAVALDSQYGYPYLHLANLLKDHLQQPDAAKDVLTDCIEQVESAYWRQECMTKRLQIAQSEP